MGGPWGRAGPLEAQARSSWAPELQRPQAGRAARPPAGVQAAAGSPPRGIWGLSGEYGFNAAAARGPPAACGRHGARSVAAGADAWGLAAAPLGSPPLLPRARRGGFAAAALAGSFCWRAGRHAAERAACHRAGAAAAAPSAARAGGASAPLAQTARPAHWAPPGAAAAPADPWGGPAAEAGAPAHSLPAEPPTSSSAGSSSAADASSAGPPLREGSGADLTAARLPSGLLEDCSTGSSECELPGALLEARERVGAIGGFLLADPLGGRQSEGCAAGADWRGGTDAPRLHAAVGLRPLAPWQATDGQASGGLRPDLGALNLDLGALGLRAPAGGRMCSRYGFAGAGGQTAGGDAGPVFTAERAPDPPALAPGVAERGSPSEAGVAAAGGLSLRAPPSGLGSRFGFGRAAASEASPGAEAAAAPAAERAPRARPLAPGSAAAGRAGEGAVAGAAGAGPRAAVDGRAASGPGAACGGALGAAEAAAATPAAQPAGGGEVIKPSLHALEGRGAGCSACNGAGARAGCSVCRLRTGDACMSAPSCLGSAGFLTWQGQSDFIKNSHRPVRRAWRRRPALPLHRRRACRCPAGRTAPGAGALSTRELLHSLACHRRASRDGAECCHAQCSAMQAAARNSDSVPRACTWVGAQAAAARAERKGQVSFPVRRIVALW